MLANLSYCSFSYIYYFILFFFFNDTATTEIYTLSLHDALPIDQCGSTCLPGTTTRPTGGTRASTSSRARSEEHTSELQSRGHLVCRLLLEKKKNHAYRLILYKKKKKQ